ncbi:SCO family protein [Flavobacterium salilacus subsp. salilacus]|uniref:SCO family protein n=1 Tax=Flavobacterium TaxID=237 RepID=UPI001075223E|nr:MULTISPECIES: SCO family protein [Flavobacterium]KAF2518895.1 SCO family protein [Flavobacterium salilacus subsp. salilacus]MBE1614945.1 SCO family protein [Flavobacterium sp. SaA2.13]
MLSFFKKYKFFFLVLGLLSAVILYLFYGALKPQKFLKIYSPADVNPELVDTTVQYISRNHKIADFAFVNQNGDSITQKDYEGKIYVADFFFTTCPTICPIMTDNMVWLQDRIKDNPKVMLLSHSVTPDIDSVPVLKAYAEKKGVIDSKWNLVTGNKKDIYYIARKSYLAVKTSTSDELYDMVHTENFILVDSQGRIRGFYNGTNLDNEVEGEKNVRQLLEDINWLSEHEN